MAGCSPRSCKLIRASPASCSIAPIGSRRRCRSCSRKASPLASKRIGGDLLDTVPVAADLYLLNGVLQQWDDEGAGAILRNCHAAMAEGAKLVIVERPLPEHASDDPAAIMLDLHMMAITGGRARSRAEFEALLSQAGLDFAKTTPAGAGLVIIELFAA